VQPSPWSSSVAIALTQTQCQKEQEGEIVFTPYGRSYWFSLFKFGSLFWKPTLTWRWMILLKARFFGNWVAPTCLYPLARDDEESSMGKRDATYNLLQRGVLYNTLLVDIHQLNADGRLNHTKGGEYYGQIRSSWSDRMHHSSGLFDPIVRNAKPTAGTLPPRRESHISPYSTFSTRGLFFDCIHL